MDLCVHFGKPAFIVLYLLYICILVFQINIFQFNSIQGIIFARKRKRSEHGYENWNARMRLA